MSARGCGTGASSLLFESDGGGGEIGRAWRGKRYHGNSEIEGDFHDSFQQDSDPQHDSALAGSPAPGGGFTTSCPPPPHSPGRGAIPSSFLPSPCPANICFPPPPKGLPQPPLTSPRRGRHNLCRRRSCPDQSLISAIAAVCPPFSTCCPTSTLLSHPRTLHWRWAHVRVYVCRPVRVLSFAWAPQQREGLRSKPNR